MKMSSVSTTPIGIGVMDWWSAGAGDQSRGCESLLQHSGTPSLHFPRGRIVLHQQRDAALRLVVQRHIDRVKPGILELKLLNVHYEVARAEMRIRGQHDLHRDVDSGHDQMPV